jgi:hypothetical protein
MLYSLGSKNIIIIIIIIYLWTEDFICSLSAERFCRDIGIL